MKDRFLKPFGIIVLSILLTHSGAAWALENCLDDSEGEDNARTEYSETSATALEAAGVLLASSLTPSEHPIARIHCLVSHYEIGPMVQASSESRLTQSGENVLSKTFLAGSVVPGETNSLWLNALFEWYALFSSPSNISRHLFLSVFRI